MQVQSRDSDDAGNSDGDRKWRAVVDVTANRLLSEADNNKKNK